MTIFWINIASTWFMVGLIWFVQIVHYPLFGYVGSKEFETFHEHHKILITPVVGFVMIVEISNYRDFDFPNPCGNPKLDSYIWNHPNRCYLDLYFIFANPLSATS